MLIGVGGEGVLTAGVLIAQAAMMEGHFVRGVQLHGLAQRGGSIPAFVRFGSDKEVFSPAPLQANADLVLAFEPLEAVRATFYARKEKTNFAINDYPHMPIYANLLELPYPSMAEIYKRVKPFAKEIMVFNTHHLAKEEFGKTVLGNTMLVGAALGVGFLPLKEQTLKDVISAYAPRGQEENIAALERGIELGKRQMK
jgi:indolepyruvate ferredoxin oxidoreductase beta subunit